MMQSENPTVAIIVLSHNGLDVTKRFLELLFAHTSKFDLIMIDNGSTDSTVEFLEKKEYVSGMEQEIVLVYNQENLGVIGGRNQGYAISKTLVNSPEYLCFLDNDQFVKEGWLEQYFDFLKKSRADLAGVDAWLLDRNLRPIHNCKNANEAFSYVGCGGMMIKREIAQLLEIEGYLFDPVFNPAYFEDPDLNFRARKLGVSIGWNSQARITHLPHQTLGKSKQRMQYFSESYAKFRAKWGSSNFSPMRQQ